jgi:hypothetical protein
LYKNAQCTFMIHPKSILLLINNTLGIDSIQTAARKPTGTRQSSTFYVIWMALLATKFSRRHD